MELVAPDTDVPFTFHWYDGFAPPLLMFELYVTRVPAQTGFADGETEILTGSSGLTVMVITLEVAGVPVAQAAFEVRTHDTVLLFTGRLV